MLRRIHGSPYKKWVSLEESVSKAALGQIIWIPKQYRGLLGETVLITIETFRVWGKLLNSISWQYNSPLTPLTGNSFFQPGKDNNQYLKWTLSDQFRLKDVLKGNALCSLMELRERYGTTPWDVWRYRQLQHFVDSLPKPLCAASRLNPWERLIDQGGINRQGISNIYRRLISPLDDGSACPFGSWEMELNQALPEEMKNKVLEYVHSTLMDTWTKEMNYKSLVKWYYVSLKIHKMNPHIFPLCWRECGEVGTHAHTWWQCHLIQSYWMEIIDLIKKISGNYIGLDPWQCLFHAINSTRKKYRAAITPFFAECSKGINPQTLGV